MTSYIQPENTPSNKSATPNVENQIAITIQRLNDEKNTVDGIVSTDFTGKEIRLKSAVDTIEKSVKSIIFLMNTKKLESELVPQSYNSQTYLDTLSSANTWLQTNKQ